MTSGTIQPFPNPQPPPPPVNQSITIVGQLIYKQGPWGEGRPVRNFAQLNVFEGEIIGMRTSRNGTPDPRNISGGRLSMTYYGYPVKIQTAPTSFGMGYTDGDGRFDITTRAFNVNTSGLLLEITDFNTNVANLSAVSSCVYELIPGSIDMKQVGRQYMGDTRHRIRVPWFPPLFIAQLAQINSVTFVDTQKLAMKLAMMVRSPAYPTIITLTRESAYTDPSIGTDFTTAEQLFSQIIKGNLPSDFPARVVNEINKIARLQTGGKTPADSIAIALERIAMINITELETGLLLNPLLSALNVAISGATLSQAMDDAAPDMAAACVLLLIAGLMAKDHAKTTVTPGNISMPSGLLGQKLLSLHVSIVR